MNFEGPMNDQELPKQKVDEHGETPNRAQYKSKEYFAGDGKIEPKLLIPVDASYLTISGNRLEIPACLRGSLLIKAIYYHVNHCGLSSRTVERYKISYKTVFQELVNENPCDEIYVLDQVSNAIKRIKGITDQRAKKNQNTFTAALGRVAGNKDFSVSEQRMAHKILATYIPFQHTRNNKKQPSISTIHKDLPFTDADYINSIRIFAFLHHSIWTRIRSSFREKMPKQHNQLINILSSSNTLSNECTGSLLPSTAKTNPQLKNHRGEIRKIMLEAVSEIDDPCYTEAIFLSIVYPIKALSDAFLEQKTDRIFLKENVNHDHMKEIIKVFLSKKHDKNGNTSAYEIIKDGSHIEISKRRIAAGPTLFSPFHLIMPYAPDEMGIYAALLLTDRIAPSSLKNIKLNDIKFMGSSLMESTSDSASRATFTGTIKIYKGRSGARSEIPTYSRKDAYYDILRDLYNSRKEAIETNLLGKDAEYIFKNIYREAPPWFGFTGTSLGPGKIAQTSLCPIVISGTRYYELCEKYKISAIHELAISASQRITTSVGGRKNPTLKKWPGTSRQFLTPVAIATSRVEADNAASLNDFKKSDDMQVAGSTPYYENLEVLAEQQFHSLTTRLNIYYNRSNSKAVIACREKFAAQVGDEMVQLAENLCGRLGESSEIINAARARELCGIDAPQDSESAEDLIIQADAQGSLLNDIGFISAGDGDLAYIIKSDFHALLIIAKIENIDEGIDSLLLSNEQLAPRAIAKRMFLTAIIDQFESSMVERAKSRWEILKRRPENNPIVFSALEVTLGDLV